MGGRLQLVGWSYLDEASGQGADKFIPGDPSLWKVIEESVGALTFSVSEGLLIEWSDEKSELSESLCQELFTISGVCDFQPAESYESSLSIQIRSKSKISDSATMLLNDYLLTTQQPQPLSIQKIRIITLSGPGAAPQKLPALKASLEKLIQFGAKSGLYDPIIQEARVVEPGPTQSWGWAVDELQAGLDFISYLRQSKKNPLSAKYVIKETGAKFKDGDVITTSCPLDSLSVVTTAQASSATAASPTAGILYNSLDPLTLILGLQARHSVQYSRIAERELESITGFRERGVSLAYSTELFPFASFLEILDGFKENYIRNFSPQNSKSFLYVSRPFDTRNSLDVRKFERFMSKLELFEGVSAHVLGLEFGLCLSIARVAAKESGMMLFGVALSEVVEWDKQQTGYERCVLLWVPDSVKRDLEKLARQYDISVIATGQKHEKPFLTIIGEKDEVQEIPISDLVAIVQAQSESTVMGTWVYEDDRRPAYGFERANVNPDRFLMRSTQKNKLEMEVGNLLSSYFSGDLSRVSLQRGSFSYPLGALRWSDGVQTYIEAGGQIRGTSRYQPRLMGVSVVDEAVRWLLSQGALPEGALGSVFVSTPGADLQNLNSRQRAAIALAFDGLMSACKEFGIRVTNVKYAPHSGPSQQLEFIFRISKPVEPKMNFTIPGFRMEDEVLYAVGPKPPFVDAGSKILPYVRVVSNHVTELSVPQQLSVYKILHNCIQESLLSSMRPVTIGGVAEALGEMAMWSGMGAKIKPSVPTIEIFSGAPGRFVVGVLPQFSKTFESLVPTELFTNLGTSGGNKVLSLPLDELFESRKELANLREDVV